MSGRRALFFAFVALLAAGAACAPERHLLGLGPAESGLDAAAVDARVDAAIVHDGPASGQDTGDGPGPLGDAGDALPSGVLDLWAELVAITCDKMYLCCTRDEKQRNALAADSRFCKSELTNVRKALAQMQAAGIVESLGEGRTAFRPERVAACLARLHELPCDEARRFRELRCDEVLEGLTAPGAACHTTRHHECAGGFCEAVACAAKKADGLQCWIDEECLSGYCTGAGSGGFCEVRPANHDVLCAPTPMP